MEPVTHQKTPTGSKPPAPPASPAAKAAREFESVLIGEMLKPVFSNVGQGGSFHGGFGETTMRRMLVDEYAKLMTANGGLGIAADIERRVAPSEPSATELTPSETLPNGK